MEYSIEEMVALIEKIWIDTKPIREITLGQNCKIQVLVLRNNNNLNLCSDPECVSCRSWDELLKESSSKFQK